MMYTDGNNTDHSIYQVVKFNSDYEDEMAWAKERLLREERRTGNTQAAARAIKAYYGEEFAVVYRASDYRRTGKYSRGKSRSSSRKNNSGYSVGQILDNEYAEAVKSGDTEKAERMLLNKGDSDKC